MLLRHSATGLLLSAAYGDDKGGGAQCQSSDTLNKLAKDLIKLGLPSNLRVSRKGETAEFSTNMRSGGDIIFELHAQSEVGQCATWPGLKAAAIAAHKQRFGGGGAAGGGGGAAGSGGGSGR